MSRAVLLVEDDPHWSETLKDYIQLANQHKYQVKIQVASGCKEALSKLIDDDYDLAIIDIELGGRDDGMCLVRVSSKLQKKVPIIIVSGTISGVSLLDSCKMYGVIADNIFLKQNFDKHAFISCVSNILFPRPVTELESLHQVYRPANLLKILKKIVAYLIEKMLK